MSFWKNNIKKYNKLYELLSKKSIHHKLHLKLLLAILNYLRQQHHKPFGEQVPVLYPQSLVHTILQVDGSRISPLHGYRTDPPHGV